ncbi:MAG TPA: TonB-dependent receptor [Tepidisphaeraceae bacterium]|jgi:iron complex outermembrane receptor protein|nr:TonB-dependent receptor [Tepidisphaeraceae bacterium]
MKHVTAHRPFPVAPMAICLLSVLIAAPATGSASPPATEPSTQSYDPVLSTPPQFNFPSQSAASGGPGLSNGASSDNSFANMSLEQLMQVEVNTDTLTQTSRQLVPAAITTIDQEEIQQQNPRSFNDLLDIYVPNFETSDHPFEMPSNGMRGIISDDNTKYLFLVDGREMNERTHFGVLTEQDLPLFGDINQVDVVRGSGSATYGPGAVAGVVSLTTYNGLTYQGTDLEARAGAIDEFYTFEFKHGEKLTADSGWFIYGGVAQLTGAPESEAPIVGGQNYTASNGTAISAGKPIDLSLSREDEEANGTPDVKAHAEYDSGGFTVWARYTRGSVTEDEVDRTYGAYPSGFGLSVPPLTTIVEYQQLTGLMGYKFDINDALSVDLSTSADFTDYERTTDGPTISDSHQEDKWISKAQLNWQVFKTNKLAVGAEYNFMWLGLPSWLSPGEDGIDSVFGTPTRWTSDMLSFFGEDQWEIIPNWTLFLSGRADKDRFTEWLFSPRGALAWAPDKQDTLKFIASQSLRTNTEEFMYSQWLQSHTHSPPEDMRSLELRYERQQTDNLSFAASVYYDHLGAIGWNGTEHVEQDLGTYQTAGFELEATYRTPTNTITLSHGYTKLIGQDFNPNSSTIITSAPYGYGYDLNNWSDNVTKLTVHHKFSPQFSADANLQVLWGYSGSQDYQNYRNTLPFYGAGGVTDTTPGYTQANGPSAFLSFGVEYNITEHATLRFDAYNVLGWVDQSLNKDNVLGSIWTGQYRVEAPAYALTIKYEF